jgi:ferrous iron transport protein B
LQCIGQAICIIFQPLGWEDHWELTVGTITGLIAKENLVGTLGTLFSIDDPGEAGEEIWDILATYLTPAAGLAFLAFNLLCAPCFAAIGAMHRELGTWKATGCAVLYQCVIAYMVSSIIYVVASCIWGYSPEVSGIVVAIISAIILVYLLVVKDPFFFLNKAPARKEAVQE